MVTGVQTCALPIYFDGCRNITGAGETIVNGIFRSSQKDSSLRIVSQVIRSMVARRTVGRPFDFELAKRHKQLVLEVPSILQNCVELLGAITCVE